jgi:hypothetical protein
MALESSPPIEYEPHIQFFKTEDIFVLVLIFLVGLLLLILWLIALMRYLRSKGIPPFKLEKNLNITAEHSKTETRRSTDNQRC